jgi:hypothetical protein
VDKIENAALVSVLRGVGFAGLGIAVTVAGLAFDPVLALRSGATLTLVVAAVLALKAIRAPQTPYKRTEVWTLLDPRPALPPARAQALIADARRRVLERYARHAAIAATGLWLASFVLARI